MSQRMLSHFFMLTQKSLCLWTRLEELATPGLCSWIGFRGFRDKLPKATAVSHLPGENYHTLAVCKDKAYPEAVLGKVEKKVPGSIFEPPQQDSSNVDSKDLAADPRASPRRMVCVCVCVCVPRCSLGFLCSTNWQPFLSSEAICVARLHSPVQISDQGVKRQSYPQDRSEASAA